MVKPEKPAMTLDKKITLPIAQWKENISNDFEKGIFALHPELNDIKNKLYTLGATYAAMSGSGAALFGLFEAPIDNVEQHFPECFCEQYEL